MSVKEYYEAVTMRFPYLKNIHSPQEFADCVSYEEQKEHNKRFFEGLNTK